MNQSIALKIINKIKQVYCFIFTIIIIFLYSSRVKIGKSSLIWPSVKINIPDNGLLIVGARSRIHAGSKITIKRGTINIGDDTTIGDDNVLLSGGNISIGNKVIFADSVKVIAFQHIYEDLEMAIKDQPLVGNEISIGDETWIGLNSIIVGNVHIGKHCVVASGSVVTKSIPSYSVVAGVPAKIIKRYDFERKSWIKQSC